MPTERDTIVLGDVALVRSGYAFKSSAWTTEGIPVVKISNVKNGRLEMASCSYVPEELAREAGDFNLNTGDILIAMTGYVGDVARVLETDLPVVLNQRVGKFIVKNKSKLDEDFFFQFLSWSETRRTIESLGYGSAQPNVSPSLIHSVEMPLPPIAEQRSIASVLGALDDKIELNRRMNATLEAMAQAVFKEWFVDGAKEEWSTVKLEELAAIRGGKQLPTEECLPVGAFQVFGANGVMGYAEKATHDGFVIAFGRVGAYCGSIFWAYNGAWINNNASSVVPYRWPEYVLQAMLNVDFIAMRTGSAQPFIPNNALAATEILLPSDQDVERYCAIANPLRLKQVMLAAESRTLAALRDTLLPKLMRGEVRVKEPQA